jgi:hypothetical protein
MSASIEIGSTSDRTPPMRPRRRRARLAAYGLWQLRDYVVDRGTSTCIVSVLLGYLTLAPLMEQRQFQLSPGLIARYGSAEAARAAMLGEFNALFLHSFLGSLIFLGALFAMNGIVANDRKLGFYRFLFAKPVSPERYYGQAFFIHWAGFVGVMALLGVVYGAVVAPILSWLLVLLIALMYLCYAGIAFLLSAAARWDWLSLVAVSLASTFLWTRFGGRGHPIARLLYLLPPLHRTDEVYAAISGAQMLPAGAALILPWHIIWWLAGYGACCFVLGLVVLRHRRLAIV